MRRAEHVTVDLHADLLWRTAETGKDPWIDCPGESLDLPRMLAGGPSLQMFTLYTPGDRQGEAATAYADRLLEIWHELLARGEGRLGWVRTAAELEEVRVDTLHGILSMEGASPLRGEIDLLASYHERGLRSLGLTHNPRNEAADGCMVPDGERGGLTPFGRDLVRACAELGILLDVAHLAPEGVPELLETAAATREAPPVISTHTGCRALTEHRRNLTDDHLVRLAATGGLAGITFYPPHVAREGQPDTLDNALDHVVHVALVCGVDHVALGADLDGFTPPGFPDGGDDPRCYALVEEKLLARGFAPAEVAKVLGGNALRVLRAVLE